MSDEFKIHVVLPVVKPTAASLGGKDVLLSRPPMRCDVKKAVPSRSGGAGTPLLPDDVLAVIGGSPLARLKAAAVAKAEKGGGSLSEAALNANKDKSCKHLRT